MASTSLFQVCGLDVAATANHLDWWACVDGAARLLALEKTSIQTEEVMNDVQFPVPVSLEFPNASRRVASSFEALECLDQQWPEWARGRSWRAAGRACRDALDGWRNGRDAYRAFLNAAKRAGMVAGRFRRPRGKNRAA